MTFWRKFHRINEDLAFAFGFSLNLLLLILIKTIKVKAMQPYNILLLQCCCVDMFQVLTSFIVKPIEIIHEKSEYFLSNGFLRPIGGWVEIVGIALWASAVFLCICSMPLSYIFRYRTVCLNKTMSKKFYIITFSITVFSSSLYGLMVCKFHYIDYGHLAYLAEDKLSWLIADDEGKVNAISFCPAVSFTPLNFM